MTVQVDAAPAPAATPAPSSSPAAPAPAAAARPANVERPRVKRSGRKLACAAGSWSGSPSGYAYSWLIDGHARRKATSSKLTVTRALRGHKVRCRVTASNDAGEASALSAPLKLR
jgi:hypothetical protein